MFTFGLLFTALLLLLLLLLLLVTALLGTARLVLSSSLLVLSAAAFHDSLLELVGGTSEVVLGAVGVLHLLLEGGDELADVGLLGVRDVLPLTELLLGGVELSFGVVLGLDDLALLAIVVGVLFTLTDHALDFSLGETTVGLDGDGLFLAGGLVLGEDVADTVGVDVEGDLNLRDTAGGGGDADEVELAEHLVVGGHFTLTLEDLDADLGLVVGGGGVGLGLLGGDGGVLGDHAGEDTSEGLDTEGEGSDVEEEEAGDITAEDTTLDGGTGGDGFVGVDTAEGFLAEEVLDGLDDLGHAGHATDHDDLVDVLVLDSGVLHALLAGGDGALDEVVNEAFELGAGEHHLDVLGTVLVGGDEGEVDLGLHGGGELALGLLGGFADTLHGHAVVAELDAGGLLELVHDVGGEGLVEVLTTEVGVTVGGLDLEDAGGDLKDGDIEGTTTKIVDGDGAVLGLLETVGEGGGGGLVDDAVDGEAGDLAGVLGGLALGVVEVGGDGDDGVLDLLVEVGLGGLLHLLEDEGTDLRGGELLTVGVLNPGVAVGVADDLEGHGLDVLLGGGVVEAAADEALDGVEGGGGVGDGLALGGVADELFFTLEGDDGGGGAEAFGVFDDTGLVTFHDGNAGVGGTEINTDDITLDLTAGAGADEGNGGDGSARRETAHHFVLGFLFFKKLK